MIVTAIRIRKFAEPRMLVELIIQTQEVEKVATRNSPMVLDSETKSNNILTRISNIKIWEEGDMVCFKERDDEDHETHKYDYKLYQDLTGAGFESSSSVVSYVLYGNDGFVRGQPYRKPGVRYFV